MGTDALIVAEEEELVVFDRPAKRTSERILDEHRNGNPGGVIEEVVGVEIAVAEVVEPVAMKLVGARASN